MISLYQKTWIEINTEIANRMVRLRKRKKISQKELDTLFSEVPFELIEEIINGQTK